MLENIAIDLSALVRAAVHARITAMQAELARLEEERQQASVTANMAYDEVVQAILLNPPKRVASYAALVTDDFARWIMRVEWKGVRPSQIIVEVEQEYSLHRKGKITDSAVDIQDASEAIYAAMEAADGLLHIAEEKRKVVDQLRGQLEYSENARQLRQDLEAEAMLMVVSRHPDLQKLVADFATLPLLEG